jgi:hypothetical protein
MQGPVWYILQLPIVIYVSETFFIFKTWKMHGMDTEHSGKELHQNGGSKLGKLHK